MKDFYDNSSGPPEDPSLNLGSPDVAILDVNCDVVSFPILGDGGVPNSFENTYGVVNVNYVTLSHDVDGTIDWYIEDYGTKEEIEDGTSSCDNRQVLITVPGVQLVTDQVEEDGSMDVTVTLQQVINEFNPLLQAWIDTPTPPKSFTKNIPNPTYTPGAGTPPPGSSDDGTPPPGSSDDGTPPPGSSNGGTPPPTPPPWYPTTTTTPPPRGSVVATTTVAPSVKAPSVKPVTTTAAPPKPPGKVNPGGAIVGGERVFVALSGPGSLEEISEKLENLNSATVVAIGEAELALDAKTGVQAGGYRPGLKWLKRVIDQKVFSASFENRVKDSYNAAVAAKAAVEKILPLLDASKDIINDWEVAYNVSQEEGKVPPAEPWLNDAVLAIDSLKTAVDEANALGSKSQALGSEVGANAKWRITQLTENAAIAFSDNVLIPTNRVSEILQTYVSIKEQLDIIRGQVEQAAALEAAAKAAEKLERERQAEEKRIAEAAAAEAAAKERQRLLDLNAEAKARAAGKAAQALEDQLEKDRQDAEREYNEEVRQERLNQLNQRRDDIRRRQRDELIPTLSDEDLSRRLEETRNRLSGVFLGHVPDPLGLLAKWLPEDVQALEAELKRRQDERAEQLEANIRRLREQQVQERDEEISTLSTEELIQRIDSSKQTLADIRSGVINDPFGLLVIYIPEDIIAYETELGTRSVDDSDDDSDSEQLWKLTITNQGVREERFKEWLQFFAGGDVVVESLAPGESITITKTENVFSFGVVLGAGSSIKADNFTYTAEIPDDENDQETTISGYITEGFEGSITISPRTDIPSGEATTPKPTTPKPTTPKPTTPKPTTLPPCPPGKERIGGRGPCVEKCPEGWRRDAEGNCYDPDPVDEDASDSSGGTSDSGGWPGRISTGPDPRTDLDYTYTEDTTTTTSTTTTSTTTYTTPYYTTPPPPCTVTTLVPSIYPGTLPPVVTTQRPRIKVLTTKPPVIPPEPTKPIYPAPILPLQIPFIMKKVTTTATPITTTTTPAPVATTIPATTTLCPEDPDCNNLQF